MTKSGYCLCRKTRWTFEGEVSWVCYCHCDDCRRNCAAPVVAWLGLTRERFQWTRQKPKTYSSSPGVFRYFCANCGSPMAFEADHYPDKMHAYAAALENPENIEPTFHVFANKKLSWLKLDDDLPKYEGSLLQTPTQS